MAMHAPVDIIEIESACAMVPLASAASADEVLKPLPMTAAWAISLRSWTYRVTNLPMGVGDPTRAQPSPSNIASFARA
jgi:hypothetical protein